MIGKHHIKLKDFINIDGQVSSFRVPKEWQKVDIHIFHIKVIATNLCSIYAITPSEDEKKMNKSLVYTMQTGEIKLSIEDEELIGIEIHRPPKTEGMLFVDYMNDQKRRPDPTPVEIAPEDPMTFKQSRLSNPADIQFLEQIGHQKLEGTASDFTEFDDHQTPYEASGELEELLEQMPEQTVDKTQKQPIVEEPEIEETTVQDPPKDPPQED